MRSKFIQAGIFALAILAAMPLGAVSAQIPVAPVAATQSTPVYNPQQLDQLLAPIALYPDQLLGQILIASTYPLEVVQAARWVQDPNNAGLSGDQLAAALDPIDWDPSVKALVPFPTVLSMMNDRLDWMQQLGDAFLAQQPDVMDSVQRLRRQAQAAGNLTTTTQQTVVTQGPDIIVQPANPQVVYVPYYDPSLVYGTWPYPVYPPYYFPPPPDYIYGPGLFFGIGFAIVAPLWGWDNWDWDNHYVRVDVDRYNRINRYEIDHYHRPPVTENNWQHDTYHRRGVAYRDQETRARYAPPGTGSADTRRVYRGYDNIPAPNLEGRGPGSGGPAGQGANAPGGRGATPSQPRPGRQAPVTAHAPPTQGPETGQRRSATPTAPTTPTTQTAPKTPTTPAVQPGRTVTPSPPGPGSQAPTTAHVPPGPGSAAGQRPSTTPTTPTAPTVRTVTPSQPSPGTQAPATTRATATQGPAAGQHAPAAPTVQRPTPPVFDGISRGADVRVQSTRGQQSRQTVTPTSAPARSAPTPSAPSGGGSNRGGSTGGGSSRGGSSGGGSSGGHAPSGGAGPHR